MFTTEQISIQKFLDAYKGGLNGVGDDRADVLEGSIYELIGGVAAIIWSRESQTDEDLFRDTQTNTASEAVLSARVLRLSNVQRYLDTSGIGSIAISRPNASGGGGTFYEGTTVVVLDKLGTTDPFYLEVAADTDIVPGVLAMSVPVRSRTTGNNALTARFDARIWARFDDIVWDTSWKIDTLSCGAGTQFEPANEYQARARSSILDNRNGFEKAILRACKAAGATRVVLFPSNYANATSDYGLNTVYVADDAWSTSLFLKGAVMLALESVRVLGDCLQIRPMVAQRLTINLTAILTDAPTKFNLNAIRQRLRAVLVDATKSDFSYSLDAWRGAIANYIPQVQDVTFNTPSADSTFLVAQGSGVFSFPSTLTKYILHPEDITISFQGPT